MKKIVIDEVIGWWPATASYIRAELESAGGAPVEVEINSPGGSVTEGIAIFNLLRDYSGDVTVTIIGLAASMASYIALAGKWLRVYENAVYMIHNAWTVIAGDHNEMRKQADILEGLSSMLAKRYAKQTGKTIEEIRALMDEESWFFGDEIAAAGFADEVIEGAGDRDKAEAVALSKERFSAMATKMREKPEEAEAVAVALRGCGALGCSANNGPMKQSENGANFKQGDDMQQIDPAALTADKLAELRPDLAASIRSDAVKAERERIAALDEVDPLGLAPETFAKLKERAIADGWGKAEFVMQIHAALTAQRKAEEEARAKAANERAEDGANLAKKMGEIQPGDGADREDPEAKERALALKLAEQINIGGV